MFGADLQPIAPAALVAGMAISKRVPTFVLKRKGHELIDDFFAEYPATILMKCLPQLQRRWQN